MNTLRTQPYEGADANATNMEGNAETLSIMENDAAHNLMHTDTTAPHASTAVPRLEGTTACETCYSEDLLSTSVHRHTLSSVPRA